MTNLIFVPFFLTNVIKSMSARILLEPFLIWRPAERRRVIVAATAQIALNKFYFTLSLFFSAFLEFQIFRTCFFSDFRLVRQENLELTGRKVELKICLSPLKNV